jgi:hypothetical protein
VRRFIRVDYNFVFQSSCGKKSKKDITKTKDFTEINKLTGFKNKMKKQIALIIISTKQKMPQK